MTGGEILYLIVAIGAMAIFGLVLAWASHRTGQQD